MVPQSSEPRVIEQAAGSPPTPRALRSMLGANLRKLSQRAPSVSALCRDLGINRTQFNRYLAGESFPRPDVLYRICAYFGVDARVLLEPVDEIETAAAGPLDHPAVADFLGPVARGVPEEVFPSGFYRFARRSFMDETQFLRGLVYVFRRDGHCFLRGFEARDAMRNQGLNDSPRNREFRGTVLLQEDGISALVGRRGGTTTTYNYLARLPSFENNYWVGYTIRPVREAIAGRRVERQLYEFLGRKRGAVLNAARQAGFCSAEALIPFHRQLLEIGRPFT